MCVCVCGQMQVVSMHEEGECVHMRDWIVFVTQESSTSQKEVEDHLLVLAHIYMFGIAY